MFASVYLRRRVLIVFGAIGVAGYLGHLALKIFPDDDLFPVVLTAAGALIVLLGFLLQRRRAAIESWLEVHLPDPVRAMRPKPR